MKELRICAVPVLLGALLSNFLVSTRANAASSCDSFNLEVFAVEAPSSGKRLLTPHPDEVRSAARFGCTDPVGVIFKAASGPQEGLVAVWRMWNAELSTFTWAAEGPDLESVQAAGYTRQFIQFHASLKPSACLSPIHWMRKGSQVRVVADGGDRETHTALGWTSEGVVFHAAPGSGSTGEPSADDFTVAVIPDTREEMLWSGDIRPGGRSEWLISRISEENLRHVAHAGDVIDWGADGAAQFERAAAALKPLADRVSLSLVPGNHDTAAGCAGGSACSGVNTSVALRNTALYNRYPGKIFAPLESRRFEPGRMDNSCTTFKGVQTEWLVLNLELWPRPEAVEWAGRVVASHPGHNVIVVTHAYLDWNASISASNGGYGATSPSYLWNNLIKVYPNIKVVLSGHLGTSMVREDEGVNGNRIISLQQCFHDSLRNPVRMIRINEKTESIKHRIYSPVNGETIVPETSWVKLDLVSRMIFSRC